jgi:hypothetical protein
MPIVIEVRTERGERITGFADPSGGTFDAAGDFDRLIPTEEPALLSGVDPYGDTVFNFVQANRVTREVADLLARDDLSDRERRGLARLQVLADEVSSGTHLYLWFVGD